MSANEPKGRRCDICKEPIETGHSHIIPAAEAGTPYDLKLTYGPVSPARKAAQTIWEYMIDVSGEIVPRDEQEWIALTASIIEAAYSEQAKTEKPES